MHINYEEHFVPVNGIQLHTVTAGTQNGPVVILLHGFPSYWQSWRRQIPALAAAGYRVIVPDQRGYNLSDKDGPYDIHTLVEDVVGLIQWSGQAQVFLVGHDWGAAVAWMTAALHPELIRKLVILNVPHPVVMTQALKGANLKQIFRSWYILFFQIPKVPEWVLRTGQYKNLRSMMVRSSAPGTFSERDLDELEKAWAQPGALTAMIGWYRALMKSVRSGMDFGYRIQPKTLLLWGKKDVALDFGGAKKSLSWTEDGDLISFAQASHWVQEDLPEEVNREMLGFLGRE